MVLREQLPQLPGVGCPRHPSDERHEIEQPAGQSLAQCPGEALGQGPLVLRDTSSSRFSAAVNRLRAAPRTPFRRRISFWTTLCSASSSFHSCGLAFFDRAFLQEAKLRAALLELAQLLFRLANHVGGSNHLLARAAHQRQPRQVLGLHTDGHLELHRQAERGAGRNPALLDGEFGQVTRHLGLHHRARLQPLGLELGRELELQGIGKSLQLEALRERRRLQLRVHRVAHARAERELSPLLARRLLPQPVERPLGARSGAHLDAAGLSGRAADDQVPAHGNLGREDLLLEQRELHDRRLRRPARSRLRLRFCRALGTADRASRAAAAPPNR